MWTVHPARNRKTGLSTRGKAEALVAVLRARNIDLSPEQRELIAACLDRARLDTWLTRAGTATSADDVFKD